MSRPCMRPFVCSSPRSSHASHIRVTQLSRSSHVVARRSTHPGHRLDVVVLCAPLSSCVFLCLPVSSSVFLCLPVSSSVFLCGVAGQPWRKLCEHCGAQRTCKQHVPAGCARICMPCYSEPRQRIPAVSPSAHLQRTPTAGFEGGRAAFGGNT